jgi:hypothetical protein
MQTFGLPEQKTSLRADAHFLRESGQSVEYRVRDLFVEITN